MAIYFVGFLYVKQEQGIGLATGCHVYGITTQNVFLG